MAESNQEDWRELCAAAAKEPDSDKFFCLVDQILKAFDDRQVHPMSADPLERCS